MGLLDDAIREHLELKRKHGADPGEVARLESEALDPPKRDASPAPASPAATQAEPESHDAEAPAALAEESAPGEEPAAAVGDPDAAQDSSPGFFDAEADASEPASSTTHDFSVPPVDRMEDTPPESAGIAPLEDSRDLEPSSGDLLGERAPAPAADDLWLDDEEPAAPPPAPAEPVAEPPIAEEPQSASREAPPAPTPAPREPEPQHREPAPPPPPRADDAPAEGEDVLEETPDFLQETPEHDRLWFEQKPPRDFDFDR